MLDSRNKTGNNYKRHVGDSIVAGGHQQLPFLNKQLLIHRHEISRDYGPENVHECTSDRARDMANGGGNNKMHACLPAPQLWDQHQR